MNIKHVQKPDKHVFMTQEEIESALRQMEQDISLKTEPLYIKEGTSSLVPVAFYVRHTQYLKEHPKVNPENYLSNLRTMIKKRV